MWSATPGPPLLRVAATDDHLVRRLVVAGLVAERRLAPRGHRVVTAARAAAERVIDRVHDLAAHGRAPALPAVAAGLADVDVLLVGVRHRADRGEAVAHDLAHFARRQAQEREALVLADEL